MSAIPKNFINVLKNSREAFQLHNHHHHGFSEPKSLKLFPYTKPVIPQSTEPEKLLIRDLKVLKSRMRKIKRDGLKHFSVVSDFDQTLTKSYHEGKKVVGTLGMFKDILVKDEGKPTFTRMKKATEIEAEEVAIEREKELNSKEWLANKIVAQAEGKFDAELLGKILEEAYLVPRPSFDTFLQLCNKYQIPFYLISAGISNVIGSILSKFMDFENYPDFHLYSNEINFDENGFLSSFKDPYLHFSDKGEIFSKNRQYNKNVLLIGDHLQDVNLARNMQPKSLLKIGYLNYKLFYRYEKTLDAYNKKYDIVIVNDGGLTAPEKIVRYILDLESEQEVFKFLDEHECSMPEALKEVYKIRKLVGEEK